jgi:hypothetical protein
MKSHNKRLDSGSNGNWETYFLTLFFKGLAHLNVPTQRPAQPQATAPKAEVHPPDR